MSNTPKTDSELRQQVRIAKALGKIKVYPQIAEMLGMSKSAFYNWLNEEFNLGYEKKLKLTEIMCKIF